MRKSFLMGVFILVISYFAVKICAMLFYQGNQNHFDRLIVLICTMTGMITAMITLILKKAQERLKSDGNEM